MIFPRLSASLSRFSNRSALRGKRVVITRAAAQSDTLLRLLAGRGATPILYPCIAILPLEDPAPLDAAILDAVAGHFDAVILTSVNTVEHLHVRLKLLGIPPFVFSSLRIAAIGEATARRAADLWGASSILLPERPESASLDAIPGLDSGARVFLPQSSAARPALSEALAARGVAVRAVTAYRTVSATGGVRLAPLLAARRVDLVTFASPSAVAGFIQRLQAEGITLGQLARLDITCIGLSTRRAALDAGLAVSIVPPDPALDQWIASLEEFYHARK